TWAEVDNLQSHYSSWPLEDAKDWRKTKNLIVKLLEDCGLLENGDRVPPIPRGDPSDFVLHLVSKIESNGFGLWSPKTEQCMGRALFPNASYFNHSCDPNTSATQAADEITFRTKRPVKQNEPLTISYIDANIPLHARRSRLQQEYYFHCMCSRCVAEEARVPSAAKV
ncbi:uncharacterized protein EV422DRAFT_487271, partial [Fimicolochytrium jonesii]|uniref:uncharacterized protein n=1 Tax=Fimicolochytrium jonesii TaxID=1396493 RepID=UPI0022FF4517